MTWIQDPRIPFFCNYGAEVTELGPEGLSPGLPPQHRDNHDNRDNRNHHHHNHNCDLYHYPHKHHHNCNDNDHHIQR